MPTDIPDFVYLLPKDDVEHNAWNDDEDDDLLEQNDRDLGGNDSNNSLRTSWSRWDSSDGAICDNMPCNAKRNYQWDAPRFTVPRTTLGRLSSEINILLEPDEEPTNHQKLVGTSIPPKPVTTKPRSLSPSASPYSMRSGKLKNCPPNLTKRPPKCVCGPPRPPVRRLSFAMCECGGASLQDAEHHDHHHHHQPPLSMHVNQKELGPPTSPTVTPQDQEL